MCNCKNKRNPPIRIDDLAAMMLIKKYVIDNEVLPSSDRNILYLYYDQIMGTKTSSSCVMCWDDFVKDKLKELWIKESSENPQS
jgi:hypothetical protein